MDKKTRWTRRRIMGNAIGLGVASALPFYTFLKRHVNKAEIQINYPGMDIGHMIRDEAWVDKPQQEYTCNVLIVGSGSAALTAAWKLKREGMNDFVLLEGPEANGNNSGGVDSELRFPTAAHYLALPSMESIHIRTMLNDLKVLQENPQAQAPVYDEQVLVHAPEERLLREKQWQDGLLPLVDNDSRRFMQMVAELSLALGEDGQPLFAIPRGLSSDAAFWRRLDRITFSQWLSDNAFTSASLLWYLNYCCRDDYGMGIDKISAWAGLHYFACRTGHAQHAENGAVLTWPDGLASLSQKLREYIQFERLKVLPTGILQPRTQPAIFSASLLNAREENGYVQMVVLTGDVKNPQTIAIKAKRVVCAIPLYMASRVVDDLEMYGFDRFEHMPVYAPWIVSNFIFNQFPKEQEGSALSWDNVVEKGPGLGYVVSTHQLIRVAKPPRTSFTAYYALDHDSPENVRNWMLGASEREIVERAASDLRLAYPNNLWQNLEKINITLRGHAMCSPTPGYLTNKGLKALQENNSRILFAHSDLSGYSVFEEAAWWGYQAALKVLS